MNKNDIIEANGKKILQSFTPQELEAFKKGALYGAKNHKEINRRSEEWYEKHNASIEDGKRNASAVCEGLKELTGLGQAVDNLSNLKTYEEIRDDVLKKFMSGLSNYPEYRKVFIALLLRMDEQDKELNDK